MCRPGGWGGRLTIVVGMDADRNGALARELLAVHQWFRRDLELLRRAVGALADGATDVAGARVAVDELRRRQDLQGLQLRCLSFCRHLEMHHRIEDAYVFPRVLDAEPGLAPVVERLVADHRDIALRLAHLEEVAEALSDETRAGTVRPVLEKLGDDLEAHLDYEEEHLVPVLDAMPTTSFF